MSQNNSAQHSEQEIKKTLFQELNINFSHRISPYNLTDAVNQSTDRSIAILKMLAGQFVGEEDCRLNDGFMYNVIMAAVLEIEDVNAIVNAFGEAAHKAKQNRQA